MQFNLKRRIACPAREAALTPAIASAAEQITQLSAAPYHAGGSN